jgi:hypothetical protein
MDIHMKLSKNFTMSEYTRSSTARRNNIPNQPPELMIPIIKNLFEMVVQPVRNKFGPTRINSGYRSPELNKRIGGSGKSQHCHGEAVDIEVMGISNVDVATWIRDNTSFDQLILEFHTDIYKNSGWIHVSCKENISDNRKQSLISYYDENGKVKYDIFK